MASAAPNSGPPTPAPSFRAHLKGVTSSNDDPDQCALCHGCIRDFELGVGGMLACCGKRICSGCPKKVARRSVKACSCCGAVRNPSAKSIIGRLKKQAKMGTVWAQGYLGVLLHHTGSCVDGLRWLEKAAEGGHPGSCYYLWSTLKLGYQGTPLNLGRAREYLERAMSLDDAFTATCRNSLLELAEMHYEEGKMKAFNSILLPLANNGFSSAQARLAIRAYKDENEPQIAYSLFKPALLGADDPHDIAESAYWSMVCSTDLGRFAIAKLLLPMANKSLSMIQNDVEMKIARIRVMVALKKDLLVFRMECAMCGTSLDRSNRKLCKGCRNHCYCSRECQKQHWNHKYDGHRAECKEAQELKVQIRDAGLMAELTKK